MAGAERREQDPGVQPPTGLRPRRSGSARRTTRAPQAPPSVITGIATMTRTCAGRLSESSGVSTGVVVALAQQAHVLAMERAQGTLAGWPG